MRATQDNQRVSARVSSKVYDAIAQAAELTGATLNQFLVQSAYEKAQEVIETAAVFLPGFPRRWKELPVFVATLLPSETRRRIEAQV